MKYFLLPPPVTKIYPPKHRLPRRPMERQQHHAGSRLGVGSISDGVTPAIVLVLSLPSRNLRDSASVELLLRQWYQRSR